MMFFVVLGILSLIAWVFWYQLNYGHRNRILKNIPAPKKWPLVHNTPELIRKSPLELFQWFEDAKEKLGKVYIVTFDPFDDGSVILSDPKVAEAILTSSKHLKKSNDYDMMKNWLGDGLLTSIGSKWRQRRKILTPAFHFQILETFMDTMDRNGNILIQKLEQTNGNEVDVHPLLNLYALDVICESAMGCRINAQNEDSDYVKAVKEIAILIFNRANDPIRRFDFIYQFTDMYRQEKKLLKILHEFTDKVIAMREEEVSKQEPVKDEVDDFGSKKRLALLDLLLKAKADGVGLEKSDIREEVDTFMFAGHDTTTSGTSFVLYNIAKYPEVQQKVYEEIDELLKDAKTQKLLFQNLSNLNYLDLVIKESFRIFPPVPYIGRCLYEEFSAGGYVFPEGANIIISPYLMGRDEEIFPNPLKFDPLRFQNETIAENKFAYIPFSAGPRNCIGQKFALMEMKSIIVKIIQNFEISITAKNEKLQLFSEIVLRSENGIVLNLKKR